MNINITAVAEKIDSTLLDLNANKHSLSELCTFAVSRSLYAVCVYPDHVPYVYSLLKDTPVKIVTVAGFPHGIEVTDLKCRQAVNSILDGADEIDMVLNLKEFARENYIKVSEDIHKVVSRIKNTPLSRKISDVPALKVIIESAYLMELEKERKLDEGTLIRRAAELVMDAGADFVKTSTGLHPAGGVKPNHVDFIRDTVGNTVGIKASGGIKSWEFTKILIRKGTGRIGTSSAKLIFEELEAYMS